MEHPGRPLNVHIDACLCGSGRLLRDCCLAMRCDTTTAGPATGYAHSSCFARSLRDCSSTISREHYISQSIFGLFGGTGVTASGLPWIPEGKEKRVSIASLTGKVLCTRHNEALSPLDAMAARFFQFFTAQWSMRDVEVYLTRGYDLEHWLLKMLCGLVMSGNARLDGQRLSTWTPPVEWLEILFGTTDVESPAGLHSIVGNYRAAEATLNVHPVFQSSTGQPIALAFVVSGIGFLFAMEELPPMRQPSRTGVDTRYRPMALQLRKGSQSREAHFGWPEGQLVTLGIGT